MIYGFSILPDGREVNMLWVGDNTWRVIAVAVGKTRDKEGTKLVWKDLPEEEQWEIKQP